MEEDGDGAPLTNANMQFNIDRRQIAGPDERAAEVATAARRKKIKEACEGLDRPRTHGRRRNRTQGGMTHSITESSGLRAKPMTARFVKSAHNPFGPNIKRSAQVPPVGCYRPKYSQQEKRILGPKYGSRSTWGNLGVEQAQRIQQAQFDERSKLCMCILKAVDQTQMEQKKDRELQRSLFQEQRQRRREELRRNTEAKAIFNMQRVSGIEGDQEDAANRGSSLNANEQSPGGILPINSDVPATAREDGEDSPQAETPIEPMIADNQFQITQHPRSGPASGACSPGASIRQPRATTQRQPVRPLAFRNQQISNTPYHLVKNYPEQTVVKQTDFVNRKQLDCIPRHIDYDLMQPRADFVKTQSEYIPSDARFNMSETYDRSTYLTKVRRVQGREFGSYAQRTDKLLRQGGDEGWVLAGRTGQFYDAEQKELYTMHNLKQGPLKFEGYNKRALHNSIYRKELSLDPHDFKKVNIGKLRTTKNTGKSINVRLEKQTKRDVTKMYKGTEAYANIQRDNENAEYIRGLISSGK